MRDRADLAARSGRHRRRLRKRRSTLPQVAEADGGDGGDGDDGGEGPQATGPGDAGVEADEGDAEDRHDNAVDADESRATRSRVRLLRRFEPGSLRCHVDRMRRGTCFSALRARGGPVSAPAGARAGSPTSWLALWRRPRASCAAATGIVITAASSARHSSAHSAARPGGSEAIVASTLARTRRWMRPRTSSMASAFRIVNASAAPSPRTTSRTFTPAPADARA